MPPPGTTASNMFPSAEEATARQYPPGTLFDIQVVPESFEV
jgi:hypothetical protein